MKFKTKKLITILFIILFLLTNISCVFAASEKPTLVSKAAIVIDSKTEKILYSKNEDEKMYPASTTKILTAILTLENCNLDDVVTVGYDAVMSIPDGYSTANLQVGEKLTVEQLLQLLLVCSANDAANCLAEYVGGSIESFVSMMNTKLNELNLSNTHFTNSYGKHDENHYTTAHDLALLMKYCIKNDNFRKFSGSASCAIPATNLYGPRKYSSTNQLILPNHSNYYSYITCGKTGFTSQAGDCLVSCAYKDDLELICVVLGGKTVNGISTRFSETKKLYDYVYSNYSIRTLLNTDDIITQIDIKNGTKDTKTLDLLVDKPISVLLNNDISDSELSYEVNLKENISAPIEQNDVLGTVSYTIDNEEYSSDLIASHPVEKSKFLDYMIQIIFGFLLLFLVFKVFFSKKKRKKKR